MNNSVLAGVIVGAVVVTVVAVEPTYETSRIPRQVCGDETVLTQEPVKDEKRIAGAAAGGCAGSKIQ